MVTSVALYLCLLAAVGLERLHELRVASRNARAAFERGGVESGQLHYRFMVIMHALFLPCCALETIALHRTFPGIIGWIALAFVLGAQVLRLSAMRSLGGQWNTRIIVVPGATPVTTGPYRFVRHPNYVAVITEMIAIPLVHGAWICAVVFSLANATILSVRIRAEEAALGGGWRDQFNRTNRLVPGSRHA